VAAHCPVVVLSLLLVKGTGFVVARCPVVVLVYCWWGEAVTDADGASAGSKAGLGDSEWGWSLLVVLRWIGAVGFGQASGLRHL